MKSISNVANLWAIEKGYFREVGIKLEVEDLDTSANVLALLAQNQLQIIEGGISAGYFNGIEKNLPITIVMDRVSSPLGHNLMLRPDLKGQITRLAQLKGKTIATNGAGLGLDLRGRQDAGDRRAHHRGCRRQGAAVPQMAIAFAQQGDRRRHRHPALHLAVPRSAATRSPSRIPTISSSRTR